MVHVLSISNQDQLSQLVWEPLLHGLPQAMQGRICRYRRWQDRQAALMGKYLVQFGLNHLFDQHSLFHTYHKDAFHRPLIEGTIDFNISHSEGIVVCAMSDQVHLGIDVERIRPIKPEEFTIVFTDEEYQFIKNAPNPIRSFFHLWTRKEAVMKADGRGFQLDAKTIDVLNKEVVQIDDKHWYFQKLQFTGPYDSHLATEKPMPVGYHQIQIEEFL